MERNRMSALAARAIQLISAAVILGISIALVLDFNRIAKLCKRFKDEDEAAGVIPTNCHNAIGRWPQSLRFAAFVGAFGLLDALIGILGVFIAAVRIEIVLFLDTLAAIFYLAGGINLAILYNQTLEHFWHDDGKEGTHGPAFNPDHTPREGTDVAFHFIAFIATLVALTLALLYRHHTRTRTTATAAASPIHMSAV